MSAFIRCILHINPNDLSDDEWHEAWGQVKFYLEIVHQVKFS
jgi:hypothetical protein